MTCPECGHRNAAGVQFCTSCQAFLEWDGRPDQGSGTPGPPAATASPDPPGRPGGPGTDPAATPAASATTTEQPTATGPSARPAAPGRPAGSTAPATATPAPATTDAPTMPFVADRAAAAPAAPPRPSPEPAPPPSPAAPAAPEAVVPPAAAPPRLVVPPLPSAPPTRQAAAEPAAPAAPRPAPAASTARRPGERLRYGDGPDHREGDLAAEPGGTSAAPPAAAPRPVRACPRCRADNATDRKLCSRCGALLDPVAASGQHPPLPWWRKFFRWGSERELAAGARPRHRAWPRPRLALPITVLLLAGLAWFARSQLSEVFTFTQDQTAKPEALRPETVRASSEASGHRAGAAFDGFNNRYWAPAAGGPGDGQYLEAEFAAPVRLRKVIITSGSSAKQDEFLLHARPAGITVTLTTADGDRSTKAINLKDQAGEQTFDLRGSDVVKVRLTSDAAFGARSDRRLAIAEVEFFGRR
ncbi:NADase-type glycan-binding domain-containing protein [Streptomyces sp. NPDC018031]|uniref:NADase-type glycan-binding domain-containing protein n=1 Tax=Streptomyces sp. NPDC018031 TaxID=3365033 RepID=UPI0037BAA4E3